MKRIIALILTVAVAVPLWRAQAQDETFKFDLGPQVGMSGYLGDANGSNIFRHPGFSAGVAMRYLINTRMAARCVFNTLGLSGNTADYGLILPGDAQYSFKSQVYELSFRYEFNFFPYGIGETYKRLKRISPYIALGIGAAIATCDGQVAFAPTIPMAIGVKYKLRERLNLALEFSMTKSLSDRFDGELDDLYNIESSFLKNTDWYSNISLSLTYEFGRRCVTCHYVD